MKRSFGHSAWRSAVALRSPTCLHAVVLELALYAAGAHAKQGLVHSVHLEAHPNPQQWPSHK